MDSKQIEQRMLKNGYHLMTDGYILAIGDKIVTRNSLGGVYTYTVKKVYKKYVLASLSDEAEPRHKFSSVINFMFASLPKQTWDTTQYFVFTKSGQPH